MSKPSNYMFKIVLLGDSPVAKAKIFDRLASRPYKIGILRTNGADLLTRIISHDGILIIVHIWDTEEQERFRPRVRACCHGAHGAFLVYDIANSLSFANVVNWLSELGEHREVDTVVALIGVDSNIGFRRAVHYSEAVELSEREKLSFFVETSVADDIDYAFTEMIERIIQKEKNKENVTDSDTNIAAVNDHKPSSSDSSSPCNNEPTSSIKPRCSCNSSSSHCNDEPSSSAEQSSSCISSSNVASFQRLHFFGATAERSDSCTLKIVLLGDSRVGKSSILNRFAGRPFKISISLTVGVDLFTRTIPQDGNRMKVHIWDTSGQERFRPVVRSCCPGAHGAFLVYDITNSVSFGNLMNWVTEIRQYGEDNTVVALIGAKSDIGFRKAVHPSQAIELKEREKLSFFMETSAANHINVNDAFIKMIEKIIGKEIGTLNGTSNDDEAYKLDSGTATVSGDDQEKQDSSSCKTCSSGELLANQRGPAPSTNTVPAPVILPARELRLYLS